MPRVPCTLALTCLMTGCLTTKLSSSVVDRSPTGLEHVVDATAQHLVASEQLEGTVLVLSVASAERSHELQGYVVSETTTQGRAWAQGGKLGRNAMFVASAAATWVGLFGVGFETKDGQWIQVGGLGEDGQPASAAGAIMAALGGLGFGTQQTVSTKRARSTARSLRQELDWLDSGSVNSAPLAQQAVDLLLGSDGDNQATHPLFDLATDSSGQARLDALSLPGAAWSPGADLVLRNVEQGLTGSWSPDSSVRARLLELPADWSTPFHASLLQDLAQLSEQAGTLVSPALDPSLLPDRLSSVQQQLAEQGNPAPPTPSSVSAVQGYLELYPAEYQASLAAAWTQQLEARLEQVEAAREQANLDWLRSSMKVAAVNGDNLATGAMDLSLLPPELLTPLFQPGDLFHGLPEEHRVGHAERLPHPLPEAATRGATLTRSQQQVGRYLHLGPDLCGLDLDAGPQRSSTLALRCTLASGQQVSVVVEGGGALAVQGALTWSLFGQVVGVRQVVTAEPSGHSTLLLLRPLYAASLTQPPDGGGAFTQILDEQGLLDNGVLRLLDPL